MKNILTLILVSSLLCNVAYSSDGKKDNSGPAGKIKTGVFYLSAAHFWFSDSKTGKPHGSSLYCGFFMIIMGLKSMSARGETPLIVIPKDPIKVFQQSDEYKKLTQIFGSDSKAKDFALDAYSGWDDTKLLEKYGKDEKIKNELTVYFAAIKSAALQIQVAEQAVNTNTVKSVTSVSSNSVNTDSTQTLVVPAK